MCPNRGQDRQGEWDRVERGEHLDNIWSFERSFSPGLHIRRDKPPVLMSQPGCASPDQLGPVGGMENHGLGDRPLLDSGSELPIPRGM